MLDTSARCQRRGRKPTDALQPGESYRISHPIPGAMQALPLALEDGLLRELVPQEYLRPVADLAFRMQRLRIDPRAQALVSLLRHGLTRAIAEPLQAETLVLTLVRRALGERTSRPPGSTYGRQRLVDRAKLTISSNPARRWKLAEIAAEVGVSPVYLTQSFQQVEGCSTAISCAAGWRALWTCCTSTMI